MADASQELAGIVSAFKPVDNMPGWTRDPDGSMITHIYWFIGTSLGNVADEMAHAMCSTQNPKVDMEIIVMLHAPISGTTDFIGMVQFYVPHGCCPTLTRSCSKTAAE